MGWPTLAAMLRWFLAILITLVIFNGLAHWLRRIGLGRLPGDFRFMLRGREWSLPIASTVLLSLLASAIAHFI
jgi:hypothetical protein